MGALRIPTTTVMEQLDLEFELEKEPMDGGASGIRTHDRRVTLRYDPLVS